MPDSNTPALTLKVVEVFRSENDKDTTDYLIADAETSELDIVLGKAAIYCQVETRVTADIFVAAVNGFPKLRDALDAIVAASPDEAPEEEDYHDTESAYANGMDVGMWTARQIASAALIEAGLTSDEDGSAEEVFAGWTRADAMSAEAEGWDIFDANGHLEIERDDEAALFASDDDAIKHVATRASAGSDMHVRALVIHNEGLCEEAALNAGWRFGDHMRWHRVKDGAHLVAGTAREACALDGIVVTEVK